MRLTATAVGIALLLAAHPAVGQKHAPLPKAITEAKTVFILNTTGWPKLEDKVYQELKSWGRFEIVDDPEKADLVFRIRYGSKEIIGLVTTSSASATGTTTTYGTGSTTTVYGTGSGMVIPLRDDSIALDVFHPKTSTEQPLWSVRKSGTLLVSNNVKNCVKELRKRFPKNQ